jgi:hypothetical protein
MAWPDLDPVQQGVLKGGKDEWNTMTPTAQANFAAITYALEKITLENGATGLSEIKPGSASMRDNGREMNVTWQKGAAKAFESHGFSGRAGLHLGTSLGPTGKGETRLHLVFGISFRFIHTENQVHIDYRKAGEGHSGAQNDDVTAPPEKVNGQLISNRERYQSWYGPYHLP